MNKKQDEITKRTAAAKTAIRNAINDKSSVGLFVAHHVSELKAEYWTKLTGTPKPTPMQVINFLELRNHWGGKEEIERFDFTLPGNVTDYVISVRFDDAGNVEDLDMES